MQMTCVVALREERVAGCTRDAHRTGKRRTAAWALGVGVDPGWGWVSTVVSRPVCKFGSRTTRFPRVSPVRLAVRGGPIENEYESRTGERGAVRSD